MTSRGGGVTATWTVLWLLTRELSVECGRRQELASLVLHVQLDRQRRFHRQPAGRGLSARPCPVRPVAQAVADNGPDAVLLDHAVVRFHGDPPSAPVPVASGRVQSMASRAFDRSHFAPVKLERTTWPGEVLPRLSAPWLQSGR